MRIVVATIVHDAEDARILHRQIGALLAAGDEVVYVAPVEPGVDLRRPGLRVRPVRRARGRRRLSALIEVRRVLAEESRNADLTVVHDPEMTLLDRWIAGPRIWDVHEDLPAQISDKGWIPKVAHGAVRAGARLLERRAGRRFSLTLAEPAYTERLGDHPVVRNTPLFPEQVQPPGEDRLVHLGRLSKGRGAEVLLESARLLPEGIRMDLFGPADEDMADLLAQASRSVVVHGAVSNPVALAAISGAMAGLALLRDLPNYRHSVPTKVLEYMAHGVPIVATPLPEVRRIVERYGVGFLVPFDDPSAVVDAVAELENEEVRARCAANGRRLVAAEFDWRFDAAVMREAYLMAVT